MSDLNTPLAVPDPSAQPTYALWADRVLAALLDALVALGVCVVMYILLTILIGLIGGLGAAVSRPNQPNPVFGSLACGGCLMWLILPPLSWFVAGIYNKVVLVAKRGASIGQAKMKLKVTTTEGRPVPMSTLFLRLLVQTGFGLVPFVGWLLLLLDVLWPLWDERRQTLHDKAVGTYVIRADPA